VYTNQKYTGVIYVIILGGRAPIYHIKKLLTFCVVKSGNSRIQIILHIIWVSASTCQLNYMQW